MSLGQNVVFGISGNFAKLVFPKISPAVLDIRDELVFYFRTPNFLQNFAKIHKKSSNFAPKHQNFPKKNIKILLTQAAFANHGTTAAHAFVKKITT